MILNDSSKYNYDIENDDEPELYTYTFDLKKLEEKSYNYSVSVWKSIKKALKDFSPENMPNFVIFCGDNYYDGLPISYQIGILGEIESNLHISLMREFNKNTAFCDFDINSNEFLVAKYRFDKKKVYSYNNWEEKAYSDYNIGKRVLPRYLFNEDWINYHGIE
ncbi:hypothetical protein [Leptospira brenneri]|uniref:Uncharacterized protein n=1 Tax=Leptospira brenneri TaxID=2023182 RepID=A0A2M9Y1B8_9LEPT|nr:hypothetical protein [Leptospira brenneri]PJZ45377.1 hypothetical protein CH361_10110 [Leptospira brenneri]TGK91870.1 hypothetical protein EHQ30_16920 [Leptospira brenneri]